MTHTNGHECVFPEPLHDYIPYTRPTSTFSNPAITSSGVCTGPIYEDEIMFDDSHHEAEGDQPEIPLLKQRQQFDAGTAHAAQSASTPSSVSDPRGSSSLSSHRGDTDATDAITKLMYDLWGSKQHYDCIPPEETSTKITENIEKMVARELYEMNRFEREAIVEELHGVKSRAVVESPDLVNSSLDAFEEEAERLCQSKISDFDIDGNRHPIGKAHIRAVETLDSNYVTAPEFRIRFLRTEFFDVKKAVKRYCRYLNHVWDLFGDVALMRQISLNDLNKQELKYLKGGQVQGLLSRDKMGRRIYAVFGIYDVPIQERARVEAYLSFAAISDDETTQINGATSLTFFSVSEKSVIRYDRNEHHIIKRFARCAPVRYTAMHFCMPDEPMYHFFKTIVHSLISPEMRASTRFHTGSPMECNYALSQFGIPVDDIPKSVTGTIKNKSIQKYIRARTAIEEYREERCRLLGVRYVTKAMEDDLVAAAAAKAASSSSPTHPLPSPEALEHLENLKGFPPSCPGTDCPEIDCIVFGDRVTYKHPPNVKFRDYLRGKRHLEEERKEQERQQHGKDKRQKERICSAEFLDEIIDEAYGILGYKFCTYDKDAGWYAYITPNTTKNRQELRKKISQLMRDERKRERASTAIYDGQALMDAGEAAKIEGENPIRGNGNHSDGGQSDGTDDISGSVPYFYASSNMGKGAKRCKKDHLVSQMCDGCNFIPPGGCGK